MNLQSYVKYTVGLVSPAVTIHGRAERLDAERLFEFVTLYLCLC